MSPMTLRTLTDSDLDSLFIWESDPRAVQMAAFTRANPSDRNEFDAHYERVRNDPSATLLAIDDDAEFAGRWPASRWTENGRFPTGSTRRDGGKALRHGHFGPSLRSSRPGRSTAAWRITTPRQRRCLLGRALSRSVPKRLSRQES